MIKVAIAKYMHAHKMYERYWVNIWEEAKKSEIEKFDFEKREQTGATQCAASNLVTKIPEKLMVLKKPQQENDRRFDWLAEKTKISKT